MNYSIQRRENRSYNQLRQVKVRYNLFGYAPGNVLFEIGNTKVFCSAMIQKGVPIFLKGTKTGWLTAEYALLPSSTIMRTPREGVMYRRNGRSIEISRLIGRALRSILNLTVIGEQTITIDCDVLQADGGTRTACLTGAYLALKTAEQYWLSTNLISEPFIREALAAISVGIVDGCPCLDLDYAEDSRADADFNVVMTSSDKLIEIQGSAEKVPLSLEMFEQLNKLAREGITTLFQDCKRLVKSQKKEKHSKVPLFSLQQRQNVVKR